MQIGKIVFGILVTVSVLLISALILIAVMLNYNKVEALTIVKQHPNWQLKNHVVKGVDGYIGKKLIFVESTYITKADDANLPNLFFVHGSPGGWEDWQEYLATPKLNSFARRIALDRPGFGLSKDLGIVKDLRKQASLLAQIIPDGEKNVIVGYSLGGPIAMWLAIDHPEKVCAVVSIAGSLSAELENPRWYNIVIDLPVVNSLVNLLSDSFVKSNNEMMALQPELIKLQNSMADLKTPLWLVQGGKDGLVYPQTVNAIQQYLTGLPKKMIKKIILPEDGHMLIWQNAPAVIDIIKNVKCS